MKIVQPVINGFLVLMTAMLPIGGLALLYGFFILPVVAALANLTLAARWPETIVASPLLCTLAAALVAPVFGYIAWGVKTGMLTNPDPETVALLSAEWIVSFGIAGFSYGLIRRHIIPHDA